MREWELYQVVVPGEPEGKGRSCLMGETKPVEADAGGTMMEGVDRSRVRVLERESQHARVERTESVAHRSRGRFEDLRLVACVTADMTDLSMSCAAQIEEIDSSKEEGSSTSAGIRLFKSSAVRFGLEVDTGVEEGWVDGNSESGNGDV